MTIIAKPSTAAQAAMRSGRMREALGRGRRGAATSGAGRRRRARPAPRAASRSAARAAATGGAVAGRPVISTVRRPEAGAGCAGRCSGRRASGRRRLRWAGLGRRAPHPARCRRRRGGASARGRRRARRRGGVRWSHARPGRRPTRRGPRSGASGPRSLRSAYGVSCQARAERSRYAPQGDSPRTGGSPAPRPTRDARGRTGTQRLRARWYQVAPAAPGAPRRMAAAARRRWAASGPPP